MLLHSHVIPSLLSMLVLVVTAVVTARFVARRSVHVPLIAGIAAAVAGLANLASALTPFRNSRFDLLHDLVGSGVLNVAHALSVPAGIALLLSGRYLARRHRRALEAAVGWLVVLAVLNVFKGLDLVTAAATGGLAWVLWRARGAFTVEPLEVRWTAVASMVTRLGVGVFAMTMAILAAANWRTDAGASVATLARESVALLTLSRETTLPMPHLLRWVPDAIGVTGVMALLLAVLIVFRRRPVTALHGARERAEIVLATHGTDTLSGFSRRGDVHHHVTADGRAATCFQIRGGVLLVGAAPCGPPDAVDELLVELREIADHHDLRMGVLGASEELAARIPTATRLRSQYVGCEALLDVDQFTLDGRPMKKVRQAVQRVTRHGYTAELVRLGDIDAATRHGIARVVLAWGEKQTHGFSMELPLGDAASASSLAVLARDAEGEVRALVHVVPTPVGPRWSLSSTPHERDLPNGVVDFLIARTVEAARENGIEQVSLNFAFMRRWIHDPQRRLERIVGWVALKLDRFFQIERLYRFNQKFRPVWVPRYLLHEGPSAIVRTALIAAVVEGQLALPPLPLADRRRRRQALTGHGPAEAPSS